MERFNVKCPDHYPMKCNLSLADREYLLTREKYKAFFIFQYRNQDEWLEKTLERYFNRRTWKLYNAGKEGGMGTKFCNVCRYALASDFGIASLTPLNFNVFQEIGLMQGLQKQVLYLLNPDRLSGELEKWKLGKLPFDIDDQIYVEHTDEKSLENGLDKNIPLIIDKVRLLSGYETEFRQNLTERSNKLTDDAKEALKKLLLEGQTHFHMLPGAHELQLWRQEYSVSNQEIAELKEKRFIVTVPISGGTKVFYYEHIPDLYRKILPEIIWEK